MPKDHSQSNKRHRRHNEELACFLEKLDPGSIIVVGAGKSGIGAQKLLDFFGLEALLVDDKAQHECQRFALTSEFLQRPFHLVKAAVLSPGISLAHPICRFLKRNNIPILSEVELGLCFLNDSVQLIGVTGTNGKSTVTHSIAKLVEKAGKRAQAVGNIGLPVSEYALQYLLQNKNGQQSDNSLVLVVELSSYQLETMYFRSFSAAVFTNFSSDHLARYKTLENYFRAKWRLTRLLKEGAAFALSEEVALQAMLFGATIESEVRLTVVHEEFAQPHSHSLSCASLDLSSVHPRYDDSEPTLNPYAYTRNFCQIRYSISSPSNFFFRIEERKFQFNCDKSKTEEESATELSIKNSILQGRHNAQNIAFCIFAERVLFAQNNSIVPSFFDSTQSKFLGLEHRLEKVELGSASKKIIVINDSKSTSFICTAQALACFHQNIHLILGGQLKDRDLTAAFEKKHKSIQKIYCIGPDAVWLAQESTKLTGAPAEAFETMQLAVREALKNIGEDEVLLFSPGAASFDSFKNFEDRGVQFKLEVARILSTQNSV